MLQAMFTALRLPQRFTMGGVPAVEILFWSQFSLCSPSCYNYGGGEGKWHFKSLSAATGRGCKKRCLRIPTIPLSEVPHV